jgi:hypothetical protein
MVHFGLLVVVASLCCVEIVSGAGYEGKRPQSQGACYYDDINEAHFSYKRDNCEGEKISLRSRLDLLKKHLVETYTVVFF